MSHSKFASELSIAIILTEAFYQYIIDNDIDS